MSDKFINDVEDFLIQLCEDALRSNPPRDSFDMYQAELANALEQRNFSNKNFSAIIDTIDQLDRNDSRDFPPFEGPDFEANIEEIFDTFTAALIYRSRDAMDRLDDDDYDLVDKLMRTPLGRTLSDSPRGQGRSYGGRSVGRRDDRRREPERGRQAVRSGFGSMGDSRRDDRGRDDRGRDSRSTRSRTESSISRVRSASTRPNVGIAAIAQSRINAEDRMEEARNKGVNHQPPVHSRTRSGEVDRHDTRVDETQSVESKQVIYEEGVLNPKGYVVPDRQGIDYTKPNPHESFWMDDKHYEVSHKSTRIPSGGPKDRMLELHDIRKYIQYLVLHLDGTVTQELIPVTDENRYVNHSLFNDPKVADSYYRKPVRLRRDRNATEEVEDTVESTVINPEAVNASCVVDEVNLDYQSDSMLGNKSPIVVDGTDAQIFAARAIVEKYEDKSDYLGASKRSAFSTYISRRPLFLPDVEQAEIVRKWFHTSTLSTLADEMRRSQEKIEPGTFETIGSWIAESIIDNLNNACNTPLKSMTFPTDWENLVGHLKKTYGDEGASQALARINPVITETLAYLDDTNLGIFEDLDADKELVDRIAMFITHTGIVATKYSLDDLGIGESLDDFKPLLVTQSDQSVFVRFVRTVESANTELPLSRIIISTACGRKVRVRRWGNNTDTIVIHRIK